MKIRLALLLAISVTAVGASTDKPQLTLFRADARPVIEGPASNFTGKATVDRLQIEGGKKEEIRAGDVIWTPPNVKHWHGAQPNSSMSHYAIVEPLNGSSATWMEKVSDETYGPKDSTTCKTPKT